MAVKIRLKRMGRKNHPFYRLNAIDSRSPRDGRVIEELGYYDPRNKDSSQSLTAARIGSTSGPSRRRPYRRS